MQGVLGSLVFLIGIEVSARQRVVPVAGELKVVAHGGVYLCSLAQYPPLDRSVQPQSFERTLPEGQLPDLVSAPHIADGLCCTPQLLRY